jgi:hypothetical protein
MDKITEKHLLDKSRFRVLSYEDALELTDTIKEDKYPVPVPVYEYNSKKKDVSKWNIIYKDDDGIALKSHEEKGYGHHMRGRGGWTYFHEGTKGGIFIELTPEEIAKIQQKTMAVMANDPKSQLKEIPYPVINKILEFAGKTKEPKYKSDGDLRGIPAMNKGNMPFIPTQIEPKGGKVKSRKKRRSKKSCKNKRTKKTSSKRQRGGNEGPTCPICMDPIVDVNEKITHMMCGNSFHRECFNKNCLAELTKGDFSTRDEENTVFQCPICRGTTKTECLNNPEVRAIYERLHEGLPDDRLQFQNMIRILQDRLAHIIEQTTDGIISPRSRASFLDELWYAILNYNSLPYNDDLSDADLRHMLEVFDEQLIRAESGDYHLIRLHNTDFAMDIDTLFQHPDIRTGNNESDDEFMGGRNKSKKRGKRKTKKSKGKVKGKKTKKNKKNKK